MNREHHPSSLDYVRELVQFDTISSRSNVAITDYVDAELKRIGFETERVDYTDLNQVAKSNVVGRIGPQGTGLAYFAHTDVVPADPWFSEAHGPFSPWEEGDRLYGRGSCDMKGSLACMLATASCLDTDQLTAPLYVVCTADEEVGYAGALQVVQHSRLYREIVAANTPVIIGEPTMLQVIHGHKGTFGIHATARGAAAHSSTTHGLNANLAMIPFLEEMKAIHDETEADPAWQDNRFHPPTLSWNIGVNDHTHAINIKAPQSVCTAYFRPMPGQDVEPLLNRVRRAAEANGLELKIRGQYPALFTDPKSPLVQTALQLTGQSSSGTVTYGTDGCVLDGLEQRIVCGPGDIAQAHTKDEWISLDQLTMGVEVYAKFIEHFCGAARLRSAGTSANTATTPARGRGESTDLPSPRGTSKSDAVPVHDFLVPFVEQRDLLPRTVEEIQGLVDNGFVVEVNGSIVGFAAIEIFSGKLAEVQCLAVAPALQGKGIGKQLIQRCVQRAQEANVTELIAITASDALFQSCGFDYALPNQKRALFIQTG